MRSKLLYFLLIVCISAGYAQDNVYDIARKGCADDMLQIIKEYPKVINYKNANGHTPLMLACYSGNTEVVEVLVKHVDNINVVSDNGTALMAAAFKGDVDLTKLLINHNADVNATDPNGNAALHYAIQFNRLEIVKLLMQHDADVHLKDARGLTALDYAKKNKNETLLKLLNK